MTLVNQVLVETLHIVERQLDRRNLGGTETTFPNQPQATASQTSSASTPTMSQSSSSGGTSSPLLFFVALGFGVVFTNLWIIVGVKYCFRYNARNRAIRNGEVPDPINLDNMPTRPHRRRREKKLMTMDEVNERFPLTKYKNWVANRASEGLPTAGGVTASPSRAASLRDVDGTMPSSPVETKHSVVTRPATANTDDVTISPATNNLGGEFGGRKSMDSKTIEVEKGVSSPQVEETNALEQVRTTASTVDKHPTAVSGEEDSDDDDHIHTAVPPELLTNPGDSCAICIDTLEEDDDIRGLTCGHAFHAGCLDPWLTSRRACCPLCKADYYVPKPRPEGEPETTGRRNRMPQPPASAWTGIRGNTRLMLPGRFAGYPGDAYGYGEGSSRRARRARREAAAAATTASQNAPAAGEGGDAGAAENAGVAAPSRWRPRNPFSSLHMPHLPIPGRTRQGSTAVEPASEPSPSQLEAGTVVR